MFSPRRDIQERTTVNTNGNSEPNSRAYSSPGCSVRIQVSHGYVDGFEYCRFSIVADPRATPGERTTEREKKKTTRLANEENEERKARTRK